jgi:hypothetical protein
MGRLEYPKHAKFAVFITLGSSRDCDLRLQLMGVLFTGTSVYPPSLSKTAYTSYSCHERAMEEI